MHSAWEITAEDVKNVFARRAVTVSDEEADRISQELTKDAITRNVLRYVTLEEQCQAASADIERQLVELGYIKVKSVSNSVWNEHDSNVRLAASMRAVISALYADRETGELTGQNTIAEKSCADFVEAVSGIIEMHGLTPPTV